MGFEKSLAILFLLIVILTRAYIFIFPKNAKNFIKKELLKWHKSDYILIGSIFLIISVAIFYYLLALGIVTLAQLLSTVFATGLLTASIIFIHSEFYTATLNIFLKKTENWIRMHTGMLILVALVLLYFILTTP